MSRIADIAQAVTDDTSRISAERKGFEVFFDYINVHRSFYKLVREAEFVDPPLFRWYYDRFAEGYVPGLETAMASGQIPDTIDPEVLAYCLMGVGDFIGMRYVLWDDEALPADVAEQVFLFMRRGMGVEGTD